MNPANQGGPPSDALERAATILETEDESVVSSIMQLLAASNGRTEWQSRHTQSALDIVSSHVENEHKSRVMEIEITERDSVRRQRPILLGIAFIGVLALSFLFLHFGRPEFIVAIITAAAGFAAGYGVSHSKGRKAQ